MSVYECNTHMHRVVQAERSEREKRALAEKTDSDRRAREREREREEEREREREEEREREWERAQQRFHQREEECARERERDKEEMLAQMASHVYSSAQRHRLVCKSNSSRVSLCPPPTHCSSSPSPALLSCSLCLTPYMLRRKRLATKS
jgi:hypothetical protein